MIHVIGKTTKHAESVENQDLTQYFFQFVLEVKVGVSQKIEVITCVEAAWYE